MKFDQFTPAALKIMLDEAGIKWRVVIVSACYSDGNIDPLKDDNTPGDDGVGRWIYRKNCL